VNGSKKDKILVSFGDLVMAMNMLCRSKDKELDKYIFQIFCTRKHPKVYRDEMIMMTINLPDMNFGFSHNVKNYYTRQIEDSAVDQIRGSSFTGPKGSISAFRDSRSKSASKSGRIADVYIDSKFKSSGTQ
jgi:hypothetical protein